jgi:putative lipase involved disintegration of autophagic bodies
MHFHASFAARAYGQDDVAIPDGYEEDLELSNRNRKVFVNSGKRHVILSERGTSLHGDKKAAVEDVANDLALALGVEQFGSRFRTARRHAKHTMNKYGTDFKYTAVGHSLGGSVSISLSNKLKNVNSVAFSPHTPASRVKQEALQTLLDPVKGRKNVSYTTALDPIALTHNLTGKAHIVKQKEKNAHSLRNFLE